jgi:putative tryptophan/tyrosine transport system substrate-binding protein
MILDFRLPIFDWGNENMNKKFWNRSFESRLSSNLKSKIGNRKWAGLLAIVVALTVCGARAEAQQPKKIPRIGFITTGFPASIAHLLEGFKKGLREHGYVEGQNVVLELRYGEAKAEQLPILATDLVRLKVDVIVAISNPAIEAIKQATQTIPIVMPIGSDPVGVGFVASLARPGGNITGLSAYSPELNGKRLELLKETFPKLSRVALLVSPNVPGNAIDLKETESAARSLRLRTQVLEVQGSADLDSTFKTMAKEHADGFVVFPGQPTLFVSRKQLVEFAVKHRLPAMYPLADYVNLGGLISYGVNNLDLFRRAATYVDKILKGTKPADLPVEQPMKFEFIINLKAAKQIGLTIPPNVLARADRVIR